MEQVMVKSKTKKKPREKTKSNVTEETRRPSVQNDKEEIDSCEEPLEQESKSSDSAPHLDEQLSKNVDKLIINDDSVEEASPSFYKILTTNKTLLAEIQRTQPEEAKPSFNKILMSNKTLLAEIQMNEGTMKVPESRKNSTTSIEMKPYTESQLGALYTNSELEMLNQFTSQYVEAELKGLAIKQHPLYELLSNYSDMRTKLTGNNLEFDQFRREYMDQQRMLWTTSTATATGKGECQDGNSVTAFHSYKKATFHRSIFQSLVRVLGIIRKLVHENHSLYSYSVESLRNQIELYIQTAISNCVKVSRLSKDSPVILSLDSEPLHLKPYISEIRMCISVLFSFQRKLIRDQQFLKETRDWLSRLVAVLLRLATYQDHLFIVNHILRCPPGVGSWAASFIQTPLNENVDSPFSSYQVNHILAILSAILTPIKERDKFLEDISQSRDAPVEALWIVVDSEGEEDEEHGTSLRENDLVALLAQLPHENLFRAVLLIERKNFENVYDISKVSQHHILRFIAFSTVFLRIIHKGLQTYKQPRYTQFAKRLSRLIRHMVQYTTDQWEQFQKIPIADDPAMMIRLQIEYDAFFLRAIYYLYTSQKLGGWQFLAVVPYHLITAKAVWKIFYFLHNSHVVDFADDVDFKKELWADTFRIQFEEKVAALADDELYYLLNTFANMALARGDNEMDFIEVALRDLLQLGFIEVNTQDICSKSARTLLTHITSKHPQLLSVILRDVKDNMRTVGDLALYLYEELPLTVWKVSDDDLLIITGLLSNPITTSESKLARMILSRLNWEILPYDMHCDVALLVAKAVDQEPGYVQWAWQTIFRLKLHITDKAFTDLRRVLDPSQYNIIQKGINQQQPLASFIAVLMTTWGHLIPEICNNGLSQLIFLQFHQKQEAVLFALYLIIPLFINSQEWLINNEKFQEIISNLLNADRGYVSMAKNLIGVQNTVLQQFGNMIKSQIVNYENYNLESPRCLVRLWINSLLSIPNWNRDSGVLYLMDVVVRTAFFSSEAFEAVRSVLTDVIQCNTNQEQGGTISSIFKWVSNSSASGSLISGSLAEYTWLAFLIIDIEHEEREVRTGFWRELLLQLHNQKGKVSVDGAIKKAASISKIPTFTSGYLCIYRWAQQAMDAPIEHPLTPLLWQKFFILYLTRTPSTNGGDNGCVGEKFFDGLVNFGFFKRVKRKLQLTLEYYQLKTNQTEEEEEEEDNDDRAGKQFNENCVSLFKALNAWLEEPKLQKGNLLLHSLPALYQPDLLTLIFQGSNSPWYEYVDYEQVKKEQADCVRTWEVANFRWKSNVNKPLLDPGRSMESEDPVERILRRLSVYDNPKAPPEIKNTAPVVPVVDFGSKEAFFASLDPCFKTLRQFAHNHTMKVSEHKALDCSYQELVPQLYRSVLNKVTKKVPCKGRNDTINCSGAALIVLEMQEARVNDRIEHQIDTNRYAYESLLGKSTQNPALALCTASVTIQQAIKVLQMQVRCNPASSELGTELFYYILSLMNEETSSYLPTKTLFVSCLEKLGQSHICGVEFEMPRLLEYILKEPNLGMYLAPHFSPSNVGTASLLHMYATISERVGKNYDVAFALMSKFDIENWLKTKEPKLYQRSKFIKLVMKALSALGYEPPFDAMILHTLYTKHLLTIFEFQFPEHYGEVLVDLLKSSSGNTDTSLLDKSVWFEIINSLSRPVQIIPKVSLREQLRQYAQLQQVLQYQELLETCTLLNKHFTQERLNYGLYGLYPKSRNYIDVYVILLGMIGHGLIVSTLRTHQGLLGDQLAQKILPSIANVFAPWIVPYSMQNLKENMASWIQQLADDRTALLPWIPSDCVLAQKMVNMFFECVQFLIHTLPGATSILSFIWQWYVTYFAFSSVNENILRPIHHSFMDFPWHNFWPSINDLESMLRIIDQYLPNCHSFLGHVFMSVAWPQWLQHFKDSPSQMKARVYQCYISLLVKLSIEPNVRHKHVDKLKKWLVEAENYEWTALEPNMLQNIIDWYVLSCDSNVIFESCPLNGDFRVLQLLMAVSGYNRPLEKSSTDLFSKRLIFVKSYVKLMSVYINKNKPVLSNKEREIKAVITHQLQHMEEVVKLEVEVNGILRELLGIINISTISNLGLKCFGDWIANKLGDGVVIRGMLQVLGSSVSDLKAVASLYELTLTSYFQNRVSEDFSPSWQEVADIFNAYTSKQTELEQVMLSEGQILALNALFVQRINRCNDTEGLLNLAVEWISNVKISESTESKIPLLWFGILQLSINHCEKDEPATGAILYKFAKVLLQISAEKGSSKWGRGLLSAIGISKQDTVSLNFRFLCRALGGYILAQLPEMKGEPQVVRRQANAPSKIGQAGGNTECTKVLMSLDFGQSQGKMKECEELALNQIQDAENSMHNATKFLGMLLKQFYIKPYLRDLC